jgi:DNA polymerase-3 subunit epsilon
MTSLSLRIRVFLFFGLLGLGGMAVVLCALWLGYRQFDNPEAFSSFATAAIVATFGVLGLSVLVWRLFDENVCKPVEHLAAQFRIQANANIPAQIDKNLARYLGDLGPAASAIQERLGQSELSVAETVAQKTARLERQRAQLLQILSDIPVAVIVASQDHQIVLYDGQAADLMEREAPVRLNRSVFDYLDEADVRALLGKMQQDGASRRAATIKGRSGAVFSGHLRRFDGDGGYTLMLEPLNLDAARPLVYDFDLLEKESSGTALYTDLRDLTFVIFDSETTGLDPQKDDVVQLGAVRVVNGKVVASEVFDTLVNPGRAIPPGSTKVHRISDEMVADAPEFSTVCRAFHTFVGDAVLVAHNAPFDMAFLHRQAEASGVRFDNPVLDTVHLSAIVYGGSAEHTLDAISERLGFEIASDHRHTALGDALATAEVLAAFLPVLEARGFRAFDQLKAEMRKHSRILKVEG